MVKELTMAPTSATLDTMITILEKVCTSIEFLHVTGTESIYNRRDHVVAPLDYCLLPRKSIDLSMDLIPSTKVELYFPALTHVVLASQDHSAISDSKFVGLLLEWAPLIHSLSFIVDESDRYPDNCNEWRYGHTELTVPSVTRSWTLALVGKINPNY